MVICDRFVDSTLAYQVFGKQVNKLFIDNIHKFILQGVKPNITFILKFQLNHQKIDLSKEELKIDTIILLSLFIQKLRNLF